MACCHPLFFLTVKQRQVDSLGRPACPGWQGVISSSTSSTQWGLFVTPVRTPARVDPLSRRHLDPHVPQMTALRPGVACPAGALVLSAACVTCKQARVAGKIPKQKHFRGRPAYGVSPCILILLKHNANQVEGGAALAAKCRKHTAICMRMGGLTGPRSWKDNGISSLPTMKYSKTEKNPKCC